MTKSKSSLSNDSLITCMQSTETTFAGILPVWAPRIEYRSDDVTKMIFLKLWDMMSYSYRGS